MFAGISYNVVYSRTLTGISV